MNPQDAGKAVARVGERLARVLRQVAPGRQLGGPPKVAVRLDARLDHHVEGEREHDRVVDDGERLDVDRLAVLHEALAADDAGDVWEG